MKNTIMTKFRRPLTLVLVLLMIVSLVGCNKKDDPNGTGGDTPASSSNAPEVPIETTTTPTEAPTETPTEAPTEVPTTAPADDTILATVSVSKLNIRKGPATGYPQNGSYVKDDRIEILEIRDGWGRTNKGWVNLEFIKLDGQADVPEVPEVTKPKEDPKDTTSTDNKKDETTSEIVSDGKTKVLGYGVTNLGSVNVRTGPGTKYDAIGTVKLGTRHAYYQKSGSWIRIKEGWVSSGSTYTYIEGTTGNGAGNGTVNGTDLNVRKGPDTTYDRVGGLNNGEAVKIMAQVNGWGYTGKGWVSMKYIKMENAPTTSDTNATVTAEGLNIRKEANKDSEVVGGYKKNDRVKILETKDGWGHTDKGWINLKHVKMDNATSGNTTSTNKKTGTVTATSLYIRKNADKNAEPVGGYVEGDKVEILETKDNWGLTNKGWICLDYVKMDT